MQTEALRANLERTAVDVKIPPEHLVLLEISEGMVGVRNDTERLLREIHHSYVGWPDTVPELHRRAMADVYHYTRHERGGEGLAVYSQLYAKSAREATPPGLRADAARWWITFLEKVLDQSETAPGTHIAAIADGLAAMDPILEGAPELAPAASGRLRRLVAKLAASGEASTQAVDAASGLLRSVLSTVYETWLDRDDPAAWLKDLDPSGPEPESIALISHDGIARNRDALSAGNGAALEELLALPDHGAIVRGYLETSDALEGSMDARTRWLCRVLGEPLLEPIHERALWTLARFCASLIAGADRAQFEGFIGDVFSALRTAGDAFGSAHLDLVRRIGVAALEGPRPGWADMVIAEILSLDFHRPDFEGFTDDWSVRVNPNHLKNIRTYLAIIGANPARASRLLAALVIHLDSGGVFASDTDLFQKDVSRLLAADIGPVYHQVRTLLRRLPVYFSDIGAEGALREVSTRIDEIRSRRDPVCHFLRKQCHVESNPRLIALTEEIARFWATGEAESLLEYLPDELHGSLDAASPLYRGLHDVFSALAAEPGGFEAVFEMQTSEVEEAIARRGGGDATDREKAVLLFKLREELGRKYSLDHGDVVGRLRRSNRFERSVLDELQADLDEGRFEQALSRLLHVLEDLQQVVLSTEPTVPVEDIYRKRHIGTGIPSMYGSYREPRLDAIGMSFRVESLVGALFDRIAESGEPAAIDGATLRTYMDRFQALARGLGVEGYRTEGVDMALSMLGDAVSLAGVTRDEVADATRGVAHHIHGIVRSRVLNVYGDLFEVIGVGAREQDGDSDPAALKASEEFLRNVIAESMSLQRIDNLAAALLHLVNDASVDWMAEGPVAQPPPIELFRIGDSAQGPGPLHLGNKAAMLARLVDYGFPIPRGFVIPTSLARRRSRDNGGGLPEGFAERVLAEIRLLERQSRSKFGDAERPLLLSVRGGAPISMPGMLNTFLNVGINPDIARGVAARSGSAWAAWDAYRRFLQFWGMSRGLDRDLFDRLMSDAKDRHSAPKKANLTADQMADLTEEYRALVVDSGVPVVDEPVEQLFSCIEMVIGSWDSAMARVYRGEIGIADGWGTAVIVQNMVYGNLHERSGTGVLLTHNPHDSSDSFELFGDFVIQGQGDDVVSGLVDTFPISERQRVEEPQDAGRSLESDFPAIFRALERLGRNLVEDHGWSHQEIEFTFEGDRAEDLFILQAREAVADDPIEVSMFRSTAELARSRLAVGIGVSGGAVSCRMAKDEADIVRLRFEHPGDPVLLVRPDTVPDDIHLLLQADGLLTAIGGATSHAAVVARRLGKTCVVGCRELKVYESEGRVEIAGRPIVPGDWISISGSDGSVYLGRHEVEMGETAIRPPTRIGAIE